jgi:PAS domain S-box-containing protein
LNQPASNERIDLDAGEPLVGGPWFFRLFLFLAVASVVMTPVTFLMPNPDRFGGLAEGGVSAIGFGLATILAHRGRRRVALVVAAVTLLAVAILGAWTLNHFDPAVLGISIVAAVLILPATPRRLVVPTIFAVFVVGGIAITIAIAADATRDRLTTPFIDSLVTSMSVLAITLAIVGWTHHRLVTAIEEANRIRSDLDASEARYRMLVETAPDGILIVDPVSLQAMAANGRAAELFGFDSSLEFLAAGPGPVLPDHQPDGRPTLEVAHALVDATLAGQQVVQEMVYRRRDGALFTAEVRSTLGETDGRTEVRLSLTDVSDRVAALRARDLTEARFRSLFASSPNAILVVDPGGRIVDASDRAADVFGCSTELLRTMVVEDFLPAAERVAHRHLRATFNLDPSDRAVGDHPNLFALRADGTPFPAEIGLSWFDTDEGRFATVVVADVTARREAEHTARDATETIRGIFDASPAGITVTGLDGTVRLWNRAMARLTDIADTDAIGRFDPSIPESRYASRAGIRAAVARNETVTGADLLLTRPDDTTVQAIGSFGPLHDAEGTVVGIVCVVEDVTAMRALEAQVNRKARLESVGQLAGGIAHDINNVLTAIGGFATLSLEDLDAGLPIDREAIATIAEGAARTGALTRQLLAFARRDVRPAETIALGQTVLAVEPMLHGLIGEHIHLVMATTDEGHVRIAGSQVEQLVINLVVNARDALPNGGTIRVEVANVSVTGQGIGRHLDVADGPYIALTVTDDGTGMPPEVAEKVFDPFFTTKGPDEGTGLGLATVHGIVTAVGGHVWVYSEEGVGTMFRIILPQTDEIASEPGPIPDASSRGRETILLVEDEDLVRVLAKRVLERAGFAVLMAENADQALAIAADHDGPIDLLLTDVIMPRILGPELAIRLGLLRPGLRVLFTSGYTAGGSGLTASMPSDAHFIDKPFSPVDLVAAVRAAIDDTSLPLAS